MDFYNGGGKGLHIAPPIWTLETGSRPGERLNIIAFMKADHTAGASSKPVALTPGRHV